MDEAFDIAYAAHTATCTFLLDSEGICRRIVMVPGSKPGRSLNGSRNSARCVGAQYVASLDPAASGCLVEMPRIGASMLFARVDDKGRVSLVRTGVITKFEQMREEHDPFESVSVKTSAPEIPRRETPPRERPVPRSRETAPLPEHDPDYGDEGDSDRTQRFEALKPADIRRALGRAGDEEMNKTAEYTSQPAASPRASSPDARQAAPQASGSHPNAPTLRRAPRIDTSQTEMEDENPYGERARGMLPRRAGTDPGLRRSSSVTQPQAQAWQGEPKVAARRRDR